MDEVKNVRKSRSANKKPKVHKKEKTLVHEKNHQPIKKREHSVNQNPHNKMTTEQLGNPVNNRDNYLKSSNKKTKAKKKKILKKKDKVMDDGPLKQINPDDINISLINKTNGDSFINSSSNQNISQESTINKQFISSNNNEETHIISSNENSESSNIFSELKKNQNLQNKKQEINKELLNLKLSCSPQYSTEVKFTNKKKAAYVQSRLIIIGKQLIVVKWDPSKKTKEPRELSEINPKRRESDKTIPYSFQDIQLFYSPLLILNFDLVTTKLYQNPIKYKFIIFVLGSPKYFKFKFKTSEIFNTFLFITNNIISSSLGSQINLIGVSLRPNFDSNFFFSHKEFASKAKTGDCLIFRGFECSARCQRCFTRAEYDHVALLQKKNETLYVYESTSKDGTKVRNWREFTAYGWNLLYDKMVYRELIVDLPSPQKEKYLKEIEDKLSNFIKETEGKKYTLNICSILCGGKIKDYEAKNEWKKSKGFFCSQLLIASYLASGIVPQDKETGSYLPGDFSQKSSLKLKQNLYLGPEVIIDFTSNFP